MINWLRQKWPWIAVVLVAMGLTATNRLTSGEASTAAQEAHDTAIAVKVLAAENKALTKGIQNAITVACEVNGNALREVIREEIREGITDPRDPRLRELFPTASPQRIREIVEEGNRRREARLTKAHNVNCAAVYKHFKLP